MLMPAPASGALSRPGTDTRRSHGDGSGSGSGGGGRGLPTPTPRRAAAAVAHIARPGGVLPRPRVPAWAGQQRRRNRSIAHPLPCPHTVAMLTAKVLGPGAMDRNVRRQRGWRGSLHNRPQPAIDGGGGGHRGGAAARPRGTLRGHGRRAGRGGDGAAAVLGCACLHGGRHAAATGCCEAQHRLRLRRHLAVVQLRVGAAARGSHNTSPDAAAADGPVATLGAAPHEQDGSDDGGRPTRPAAPLCVWRAAAHGATIAPAPPAHGHGHGRGPPPPPTHAAQSQGLAAAPASAPATAVVATGLTLAAQRRR